MEALSQIFFQLFQLFLHHYYLRWLDRILRGLIILAVQMGILSEKSGTYTILYATSMSVFYFLPVLLAFTSGRRFVQVPIYPL